MKRRLPVDQLHDIVNQLQKGDELEAKHRNHILSGNYAKCMECHIQPDWLLVYEIVGNELYLLRTGTHADLFK